MDRKGQGALEYLLLIGGAVLVAAIVIALITGIPGDDELDPQCQAACSARTALGSVATTNCTSATDIPASCGTTPCSWDATGEFCYAG